MDVKQEKQRLPKAIICHVIILYIQSDLYGEGEKEKKEQLLASCYYHSLKLALEKV